MSSDAGLDRALTLGGEDLGLCVLPPTLQAVLSDTRSPSFADEMPSARGIMCRGRFIRGGSRRDHWTVTSPITLIPSCTRYQPLPIFATEML